MRCFPRYFLFLSFLFLTACSHVANFAPVGEAWSASQGKPGSYVVQPGDTLYAIAWRYNLDYRALAEENNLPPPYVVKVGQVLSVKPVSSTVVSPVRSYPAQKVTKNKASQKISSTSSTVKTHKTNPSPKNIHSSNLPIRWIWPARGKIVAHYSPTVGQKGIDIAGQEGEPILAAAAGKVAYCGNGLRGYGNLIIIKHNDEFLSAYAHNQTLLVHDGEEVQAGQKIATMGQSESKRVMLHFEIREAGKSVNPLLYVKP
jgi:lipoprotein NlpD